MQVETIIRKFNESEDTDASWLRSYRTIVGGGGSRWNLAWTPEPKTRSFAEILIRTTSSDVTKQYVERVRAVAENGDASLGLKPIVGARVVPVQLALGPPADPLVFRISGDGFADSAILRSAADRLSEIVDNQPETWNVNDSWGTSGYQVRVDVDQDQAVLAGVTNAQIAQTLGNHLILPLASVYRREVNRFQPSERFQITEVDAWLSTARDPIHFVCSLG